MKKKSIIRMIVLFSLSIILYGCPPDLDINPETVTKIYNEGGNNFCYVSVKNTSTTDWCQFARESDPQYLHLVSATPAPINNILNPLETVVFKYQIDPTWNPGTACPGGTTPCTIGKIEMWARWDTKEEHDQVTFDWSNPVTQVDCWVTDGGGNDNNYRGELCDHPNPNNNTTPPVLFKNVGDVYNPNAFDILVLVDNSQDADTHIKPICVSPVNYGDTRNPGTWVTIQAHSSYPYGDKIRMNFGGLTGACSTLNNGSIYVYSTQSDHSDGASKWIPIKFDMLQ
jgi:hypothetical protein